MKKTILVHLIFSLFLKQFRLGASTVSWSKLFHLSMTRFEKKYFRISVLNLGLQILYAQLTRDLLAIAKFLVFLVCKFDEKKRKT